jgi:hypothetical protein
MRHVEETGGSAGVQVLLEDAAPELDRHLVTGKRSEARAELDVQRMERRALEIGRSERFGV